MKNFYVLVFALLTTSSSISFAEAPSPAPSPTATPRTIDWEKYDSSVILKTYRGKNSYICSAVMLSDTLGLTTAHCIARSEKNEVLIGMSLTDKSLRTLAVDQKSIRIHPKYKPAFSLYDHDLATFTLKEKAGLKFYPLVPEKTDATPAPRTSLDRVGFGMRNNQNSRTWTEVFVEKQKESTLFLNDALSVFGDSGSPIYQLKDSKLFLIAIHSTLIEEGHVAAPLLSEHHAWIFDKMTKK